MTNDNGFDDQDGDGDFENSAEALEKQKAREEFAQMLDASFKGGAKKRFNVGDKVRGEILVIGKEEIYVSLGSTNEGVISRRDLQDESGQVPHAVGDKIDLFVTLVRGGEIRLSPKPTSKNLADDLEDAFDMMLPVEGRVAEIVNGGFRVNVKGKLAFCPISQMDIRRIEQPEEYIGKKFEFRITKFEESGRNIVVSRRKILDEEREQSVGHFASEHKAGDVVQGKVARLEKFGAFIELAPGIDGLAHVSELAWSRVGEPSEVLQVGQEVSVKILKIESLAVEGARGPKDAKLRISLSVKQTGERPQAAPDAKDAKGATPGLQVGAIVQGKVERREPYGLFVKIAEGATGLLHKSKTTDRPEFPYDKLKVGEEITVQIAELRPAERRISLELPRDPNADDWKGFVASPSAATTGGFGTLGDKFKAAMAKKK